MKGRVIVNILTPSRLVSKEEGKQFLEKWVALAPQYAPERYGGYEPVRSLFDPENIDAAVSDWDFSFLFTRRKPRMRGTIFMGDNRGTTHGWIKIAFEYKPDLFSLLKQFFMEICTGFEAEFACMQLMPGKEEDLRITTHRLRQGIPDLYWLTLFGKPYVKLFGRERILSSPNAIIEEPKPGMFSIQLSEDISAVATNSDELFQIAQRIKQHLNNNAFFDIELGRDYAYNIPEFQIRL
ncbi:MAG TPA: hypothetical protein VE980_17445 [Pyrinomonadaceae bacterium]|nr:hypothetical protein [Pyrinomonadaceae bacterium]